MEERKYPVLLLRERNARQAMWMRTDGKSIPELEVAIGQFVLASLRRFRLKCFEIGAVPDIVMTPLMLNTTSMAALELDTWRSQLEEMCADVERGIEN